jgi:predicted Fe-Mo cluster-binding NifX family protein
MKVAISAQSNDIDSLVDPRFGRARWLIVADSQTGEWQAHDNAANVNASGGAGVQAASAVAAQGVKALITGNVGPNAHRALAAGEIAIYQVGNGVSARDALDALRCGELTSVDAPTVSGHWA